MRGPGAGLASAAFVGIVPSYISRSVAGSYDNEGVAIFALMFVFFFYIKVAMTHHRALSLFGFSRQGRCDLCCQVGVTLYSTITPPTFD